jgi:cytochrome c biogenesis factor
MIELIKGVPWSFGPMTVTFLRFQLEEQNMESMRQGHSPTIGAVLEVKIDSAAEELVPLTTFKAPPSKPEMKAAYIKSGHLGFLLVKLNISGASAKTKIIVQLVGPMMASTTGSQPDVLVAEVSVKPFMGFIWIAAFFIMSGIIAALARRMQKTDAFS